MSAPAPRGTGAPAGGRRSRADLVRVLAAVAVIAAAAFFALTSPVRLGLDLRGGTQIVLETRDTGTVVADAASTDRVVEVLRKRVDALGVSEPTLARSGDTRIIVELPGVQDPREAAETIGRTAQLTFHPVVTLAAADAAPAEQSDGSRVVADESGQLLELGPPALTGDLVSSADVGSDPQSGAAWYVSLGFGGDGAGRWQSLTADAACSAPGDPSRRVAIVLDGAVISSPQVDPSIACGVGIGGGGTQITGSFSVDEAKDLAALIRGGSLPLDVEVVEQRTVGPTLGAAAIEASLAAALIGLALTALFITLVYRLVGVVASIALACYSLISYAMLVAIGATLTLPGLAGFVLAIGLAIDANVLVFERAREEYAERADRRSARDPSGLQSALRAGFEKAWTAIIDSNVTTLIAAGLLFFLASGPVRGFGVTLGIGVLASMVSALVIARVLTQLVVRSSWVQRHPASSGLTGNGRIRRWLEHSGPDLMRRSRLWLGISGALVLLAVTGVVVRGLDLGVEFTGGRLLEYSTSSPVSVDEAREVLASQGLPRAVVQTSQESGGAERISVRTDPIDNDQAQAVEDALEGLGGEVTKLRDELVGPTIGAELRGKAIIALGVALLAQMAYLAVRFRWTFGAAAVLTMLHDVLIVVGVFAWLGRPVDGVFLAATLTIVGLSVNDTVVVFDRVRELRRARPLEPFASVANRAVLQTVPRTINTGLGAMAILGALVLLGGDSLADFALALLLGLVVGTLSSVVHRHPAAARVLTALAAGRCRWWCRSVDATAQPPAYAGPGVGCARPLGLGRSLRGRPTWALTPRAPTMLPLGSAPRPVGASWGGPPPRDPAAARIVRHLDRARRVPRPGVRSVRRPGRPQPLVPTPGGVRHCRARARLPGRRRRGAAQHVRADGSRRDAGVPLGLPRPRGRRAAGAQLRTRGRRGPSLGVAGDHRAHGSRRRHAPALDRAVRLPRGHRRRRPRRGAPRGQHAPHAQRPRGRGRADRLTRARLRSPGRARWGRSCCAGRHGRVRARIRAS